MPRKIYAVQMSYEVPSEDKDRAEKALRGFDFLLKKLQIAGDHLDLMYVPFKENTNITPEQTYKARAALRRYRDKVADNFNSIKRIAFRCYVMLQPFSSDTQIVKISKAFIFSMSDIEKQVNRFIELFSSLEAKDFSQTVVKAIENVKKEVAQLEQIIEDRIKNHIENNILARNWVDSISTELQEKVEKRIPLSIELVNERNEALEKDRQ
jgi:hypothetical protein